MHLVILWFCGALKTHTSLGHRVACYAVTSMCVTLVLPRWRMAAWLRRSVFRSAMRLWVWTQFPLAALGRRPYAWWRAPTRPWPWWSEGTVTAKMADTSLYFYIFIYIFYIFLWNKRGTFLGFGGVYTSFCYVWLFSWLMCSLLGLSISQPVSRSSARGQRSKPQCWNLTVYIRKKMQTQVICGSEAHVVPWKC